MLRYHSQHPVLAPNTLLFFVLLFAHLRMGVVDLHFSCSCLVAFVSRVLVFVVFVGFLKIDFQIFLIIFLKSVFLIFYLFQCVS